MNHPFRPATMQIHRKSLSISIVTTLAAIFIVASSQAQPRFQPGPQVVSPEVSQDRQVTFRILAPKAGVVQLASSGDIPGIGFGQAKPMTKGTNGIWEVSAGPLPP